MKKLEVFDPAMCCSTGVCGVEVDPVLAQFAQVCPHLELELLFPMMEDLSDMLLTGRAQLGIGYQGLTTTPALSRFGLGLVEMPIVVAPHHPLAQKRQPTRADLQAERQLIGRRDDGVRAGVGVQQGPARPVAVLATPAGAQNGAGRQAQAVECCAPALLARVRVAEPAGADQEGDRSAPVRADQVVHQLLGPLTGGRAHGGPAGNGTRAVQQDDGDAEVAHLGQRVLPDERAGEQQPVDLPRQQILDEGPPAAFIAARIRDQDAVIGGRGGLGDREGQLGAVRVQGVGDDQAQGVGGAAAQGAGAEVRPVLQHLHGVPHACGGRRGDGTRAVVDHVADHGGAHAGVAGDVAAGDASRPCGTRHGPPPSLAAIGDWGATAAGPLPRPVGQPKKLTFCGAFLRRSGSLAGHHSCILAQGL